MTIRSTGYAHNPFTGTMDWVGKVRRPPFYYDATEANVVKITGSDSELLHFVIGNRMYLVNQDLRCNLNTTGPGGLDRGDLTANTPYYLYAIFYDGSVYLIASVVDPGNGGPQGYDKWTYIGAMATRDSATSLDVFQSSGGVYLCSRPIEEETRASGAGRGSAVFASMPLTVAAVYVCLRADVNGAGAADFAELAPSDTATETMRVENNGTAGFDGYAYGWVPIFTAQTLWLTPGANSACDVELLGWREDPTRWA